MAAGSGTRMGGEKPKQFIELGGKAVLQMTIEKFLNACPDIKVVTVLPDAHMEYWRNYCLERNFLCPQTLVKGALHVSILSGMPFQRCRKERWSLSMTVSDLWSRWGSYAKCSKRRRPFRPLFPSFRALIR